jgi:hypothetical protein
MKGDDSEGGGDSKDDAPPALDDMSSPTALVSGGEASSGEVAHDVVGPTADTGGNRSEEALQQAREALLREDISDLNFQEAVLLNFLLGGKSDFD